MDDLVDVERWRHWRMSRRGSDRWRRWADDRPALAGWSVAELSDPRWSPAVDRLQADLVALAQDGEGWAAITLLVQLRPGLLRLVRTLERTARLAGPEAVDEVRAEFHQTVWHHRLDRRPRRIAANLILDTRQRLTRRSGRRVEQAAVLISLDRLTGPIPVPHQPVGTDRPESDLAPTLALRRAIESLPGTPDSRALTATAAYRAWFLDQPHEAIASELGVERAAVAARLHRLRAIVRRHWEEAA